MRAIQYTRGAHKVRGPTTRRRDTRAIQCFWILIIIIIVRRVASFQPLLFIADSFIYARLLHTLLVSSWIHLIRCLPLVRTPSVLPSIRLIRQANIRTSIKKTVFRSICFLVCRICLNEWKIHGWSRPEHEVGPFLKISFLPIEVMRQSASLERVFIWSVECLNANGYFDSFPLFSTISHSSCEVSHSLVRLDTYLLWESFPFSTRLTTLPWGLPIFLHTYPILFL